MQKEIKGVTVGPIIEVLDEKKLKNSAVVNELNNHLTFEDEIASDIIHLCGEEIKKDCLNKIQPPLSVGSAFITDCSVFIIHAVVCEKEEKPDFYDLCDATRNSLLLAETNQLETIVFPSIGAYVGRLTAKEAIFTIMEHIQYVVYNASFEYLKHIQFYAKSENEKKLFEKYFNEVFGD